MTVTAGVIGGIRRVAGVSVALVEHVEKLDGAVFPSCQHPAGA